MFLLWGYLLDFMSECSDSDCLAKWQWQQDYEGGNLWTMPIYVAYVYKCTVSLSCSLKEENYLLKWSCVFAVLLLPTVFHISSKSNIEYYKY